MNAERRPMFRGRELSDEDLEAIRGQAEMFGCASRRTYAALSKKGRTRLLPCGLSSAIVVTCLKRWTAIRGRLKRRSRQRPSVAPAAAVLCACGCC